MRAAASLAPLALLVVAGLAACGGTEDEGKATVSVAGAGAAGDAGATASGGMSSSGQAGAAGSSTAGSATAGSATAGSATAGSGTAGSATAGTAGSGTAGTTTAGAGGSGVAGGSGGTAAGAAGATQAGCLGELDALGIAYKKTSAKGVVDAVNLLGPVNGVLFTNGTKDTPTGDPMACAFVKTIWAAAGVWKKHGFVKIGTLGSYCYRCCCAWSMTNYCRGPNDPEPDCGANGYSNHSWGRAMDVRYLYKADGTMYDVNDPGDFVLAGTTDTCGAGLSKQTGVSLELYQAVCDMKAQKVFSTILTPNYNADHRNHFHMDIGMSGPASGFVVKSWSEPTLDVGEHPDACGE